MSDNHYRREIFDRFPDIYKYLFREEIMKKDQEIFQERSKPSSRRASMAVHRALSQ